MRNVSDKELREIQINLFKQIADFCKNNNLRYYLWGGTLIGAVRHQGYIPWDDDIDIAMPREDYNYLVANFSSDTSGIFECNNSSDYPYTFAKAFDKRTLKLEPICRPKGWQIGIDIDIFPLDYSWKENASLYEKKRSKLLKKWRYSVMYVDKISSPKDLAKKAIQFFYNGRANGYARKINLLSSHNEKSSSIMLCSDSNIKKPLYFDAESYGEGTDVVFEGMTVKAPSDYDAVLRKCFGDYMQLPPVEQRVTHHTFEMYWKEN